MYGLWYLLACGVQGPPQPPRLEKPERITDLAVTQIGRGLEFRFTTPARATDGERLTKPLEVQIFRTLTPAGQKPLDTPEMQLPWTVLQPDDLLRYERSQKTVFPSQLSEQEFTQGQGAAFTFALRALTRGFRRRPVTSEFSNLVRINLLDVSVPPGSLRARTTEKAMELTWSPPKVSLTGRALPTLPRYRVYRSGTGKPDTFEVLGDTASATYLDPDFEFEHNYFYKVRALFRDGDRLAESEDSPLVQITSHDTFPPAAPTGLTALYTAGAVELIWTANSQPDLAGYHVYRGEEGGPARRVNQDLVRTPIFRDSSVSPGQQYFYRVTAVDLTNNESPSSAEVSVESQ